jgi:hypothetical protein
MTQALGDVGGPSRWEIDLVAHVDESWLWER